jgi:hypothetical protein
MTLPNSWLSIGIRVFKLSLHQPARLISKKNMATMSLAVFILAMLNSCTTDDEAERQSNKGNSKCAKARAFFRACL